MGGTVAIGAGTTIEQGCILATYGGRIVVGENSFIGPYCVLYGHGGLRIGHHALIATHTVMIPANHGFTDPGLIAGQPLSMKGIDIGAGCWIGCGVSVLDGVRIGEGSVIGAGSVVSRDIPDRSIAVGVPARIVRQRNSFSYTGGMNE
jgi:acetyltransferase-like isoleucine patch superfamily enzyme